MSEIHRPMTPATFLQWMETASRNSDPEVGHCDADEIMCILLTDLGYGEGVEVFAQMTKWYA